LDDDENDFQGEEDSGSRRQPQREVQNDVDPTELVDEDDGGRGGGGAVESYLDSAEDVAKTFKKTSFGDSNRWGKGGELFDHTQLEQGSYLDTYEKDQTSQKKDKNERFKPLG